MASSQERAPGHCARASALSGAISCATSSLKRPPPASLHQLAPRLEPKSELHACFTSKQPQGCGASTTAVRKSEFEERGSLRKRCTRSRRCVHNNTQRHNNTDAESHSPNLIHITEIRMACARVAEGVPAGCEHPETQSNTRTYGTRKSSYVHAYIGRDGKWRKRVQT